MSLSYGFGLSRQPTLLSGMGRADHNITFVMATTRVSISDRIYGAVVFYFVTVNPQVLQRYISLLTTDSKVFHMRKGDAAIHTCVETGFPYSAATERERERKKEAWWVETFVKAKLTNHLLSPSASLWATHTIIVWAVCTMRFICS